MVFDSADDPGLRESARCQYPNSAIVVGQSAQIRRTSLPVKDRPPIVVAPSDKTDSMLWKNLPQEGFVKLIPFDVGADSVV